jgi:eukaryotic-like serine/threonine-protein kinase
VLARPDSAAYRLRKFVLRHRGQTAAAAGVALLLVGAASVSLWQAANAREAAVAAAGEARRSQAVQSFLVEVFSANSLRQSDPQRARQATARELLDAGAVRATEALKTSPQAQEAVLDTLADLYFQLELFEDAARMRRGRIDALERAFGSRDPRIAEAWLAYSTDVADTRQRAEAAPAIVRARELLDAIGDHDSEMRGWVAIESARLEQYTSLAAMRRHADEALAQFRARPRRWTNLFHALQIAARARCLSGDPAGAIELHREAIALARRSEPKVSAWLITPWVQMAEAETDLLELGAAEDHLREALATARRLNGDAGAATVQTQAKLAGLLHFSGRSDEGWALLQDAQAALERPGAKATPDAKGAVRRIAGHVAAERGNLREGLELLGAEVAALREEHPAALPLARSLLPLGAALRAAGRLEESTAALDEAGRILAATAGREVPPALGNALRFERARLALARGEPARASDSLQGLTLTGRPLDAAHALVLGARSALSERRFDDAAHQARQALQRLAETPLAGRFPRLESEAREVLAALPSHQAGSTKSSRAGTGAVPAARIASLKASTAGASRFIAAATAGVDSAEPGSSERSTT